MQLENSLSFKGVSEWEDEFLWLFPHRHDYIYAKHPEPGQTPDWKTESRHPLSDRTLCQGSYLYGVRFSKATNYCILDIDAGSIYPQRDRFAISRILAALELLGLVTAIPCTSSYSGGFHLYFPFQIGAKLQRNRLNNRGLRHSQSSAVRPLRDR